MILWFLIAALTLVVLAVLLLPMLRAVPSQVANDTAFDQAVYRDQLAELERDVERGIIAPAEAEAARNEISRRLLQSAKATESPVATTSNLSTLAKVSVLLVPLAAIPLYLNLGEPKTPDVPLKERLANAIDNKDMPAMLARVEAHLDATPDDLAGWQTVLEPYKAEKRWDDASNAIRNIIRLQGPTADLYADYAEMVMMANNGDLNKEAHEALTKALAIDPNHAKARFFDALAFKQEGNTEEAKKRLEAMLASAPADAPYRDIVQAELANLNSAKAPALSQEQMQAGAAMSAGDRATMINTMIDGLEQRLGTTSTDIEGWKRLIRARAMNQQQDKAKAALATAQTIFKDQTQALDQLKSLAAELGI